MQVYKMGLPILGLKSDLCITKQDYVRPHDDDRVTPLEIMLKDKYYMKFMFDNKLFFDIQEAHYEEAKGLVIFPESENLFNMIEDEKLSVCCGVSTDNEDIDICPRCGEHTDFLTEAKLDEL